MASKQRLKTAFKKTKTIAPLHTTGPATITPDGTRLLTCVAEHILCTDVASGEEIGRFKGDNTDIMSLTVSPASTHLAVFYGSLTLRIFELPPPGAPLPPSATEASSSTSQPTFRPPTYPAQRTIPKCHDAPVHVCRIDPSSTLLASGSADGVVKVWDLQRGYVTHMFKGHGGVVSALAFNYPRETSTSANAAKDDRMHLVTASADTRIRIFNLRAVSTVSGGNKGKGGASMKPIDVLEGHVSVPRGLDITADGRWLVSGGRDAVAMIWDLTGGSSAARTDDPKGKGKALPKASLIKTIPVLERVEAIGVLAVSEVVASSSDVPSTAGRLRFYTGGAKGVIRIWDATDAKVIASYGSEVVASSAIDDTEDPREIVDVIYTPKRSTITSLHGDQNIMSYSLTTGQLTKQYIGFNDEIIDARFLSSTPPSSSPPSSPAPPHGNIIALATNSPLIRLYDTTTLDARLLGSHTDMVLALDSSIDGKVLVTASKDNSARVWMQSQTQEANALDWRCVGVAEGHAESVGAIAISRDSEGDGPSAQFMFTGSQDRTVKMWDLSSTSSSSDEPEKLKSLLTLRAHEKDINSLDIAPNNRLLATGSQDKTCNVYSLEFTPSSSKGKSAKGALKLIGTCKGHKRGVWSVKFSRTERFLASASGDKSVKLWSLDDFSCLKTFEGHTNTVLRVDFITQGQQLVSTASDGLVKVWNIKDEECVTSLDNHEDKIWALAISQDESTIVSGAADSVVTFWTDCTDEVRAEKETARAELILKEQDFQNYVHLQDYESAIRLALTLNHPGRLLSLLTSIRTNPPSTSISDATSITGSASVDLVIASLSEDELIKLLGYVRDWNTTARTSGIAQGVLHAVLKGWSAESIMRAFERKSGPTFLDDMDGEEESTAVERRKPNSRGQPLLGLKDLIDGLLPYTERHLARADRLVQESYVVDYVLGEMDMGMLALDQAIGGLDIGLGAGQEEEGSELDSEDDSESEFGDVLGAGVNGMEIDIAA